MDDADRRSQTETKDSAPQGLETAMRLRSYVVRWDHGFAPNPFYRVCTLATCKPAIRKATQLGDYVLGTGSAERGLNGKIIFLMQVTEIVTFDEYWRDERFARKIPIMNGSLNQRFGDNIYHRETPSGEWIQADSRHSQADDHPNLTNLKRDTGKTEQVLIGSNFIYWGGDGPKVPSKLGEFVHDRPSHLSSFTEDQIKRLLSWVDKLNESGYVGDPYEWRFEKRWR